MKKRTIKSYLYLSEIPKNHLANKPLADALKISLETLELTLQFSWVIGHSVRHAATSLASNKRIDVDTNRTTANWT